MNNTVDAHRLKSWLDNGEAILIDVRDGDEYNEWRIPQASLIPAPELNDTIEHLQREGVKVVLHCLSGTRSNNACQLIADKCEGDLYQLEGGITAWQAAGFKTIDMRQTSARLPLMRQVLLCAGLLLLTFSALGIAGVKAGPYLTAFIGAGLTVAGATGWCGMGILLSKMPWNK